jgi:hypothetical protein
MRTEMSDAIQGKRRNFTRRFVATENIAVKSRRRVTELTHDRTEVKIVLGSRLRKV